MNCGGAWTDRQEIEGGIVAWFEAHSQLLLVLITAMYVGLTFFMLREVRHQSTNASEQLQLVRQQMAAATRPLVLIERQPTANTGYVVRNVGPGVALDVVYVRDHGQLAGKVLASFHHLGALPSGSTVPVPAEAAKQLNSFATAQDLGHGVPPHIVLARPIAGNDWTVTQNVVQPRGGHVRSIVELVQLSAEESTPYGRTDAVAHLDKNWARIRSSLRPLIDESSETATL
jgi:hypothetical protein